VSGTDPEQLESRIADLEQELALLRATAAVRRTSRKGGRDWDAYAAVIASLVGLLALAISGYTAYVQRQQTQAQVWPKVALGNSNMLLKLYAYNWGVGPARLTAVRVTVDDKPMGNWSDVVRAFGYGEDSRIVFSSLSERVMPAGMELEFATPRNDEPSRKMFRDVIESDTHAFGVTVCYCSVLDDCWVARYGSRPKNERDLPDDVCPVKESDRFHN
jgi:hypothetical protein